MEYNVRQKIKHYPQFKNDVIPFRVALFKMYNDNGKIHRIILVLIITISLPLQVINLQ